jgi:hypothetical protein
MSSGKDSGSDLLIARTLVLRTIERRIKQLHFSSPPPESYYSGQEYVEDKRRVNCVIAAHFQFSGTLEPTQFHLYSSFVSLDQRGPLLIVTIRRPIAQKLFDDIKFIRRGDYHIVAYLVSCLPKINRVLTDNRYYNGHLLSKNFSIFDALSITLVCKGQLILISWPSLSGHPTTASVGPPQQNVHWWTRSPRLLSTDAGRA